jgi:hypothetical protein
MYFILLFLRDLRGKNRTDFFWFRTICLIPLGRMAGLSELGYMKTITELIKETKS